MVIDYHPKKANLVADALSQKSVATLAHIHTAYVPLLLDLKTLGITLDCDYNRALVVNFVVRLTLIDQIRDNQIQDSDLVKKVQKIMDGEPGEDFVITVDEMLVMKGGIYVPNVDDLRKAIMEKTYCSIYAMHSASIKMY